MKEGRKQGREIVKKERMEGGREIGREGRRGGRREGGRGVIGLAVLMRFKKGLRCLT